MKTIQFLIILLFAFSGMYAKSWHFNSIHISATVNPDGSMHIRESRSYQFSGAFSWADYHLSDLGEGTVTDFKLQDNYGLYSENESEMAGSYFTEKIANQFYCKWFYEAQNETRTFIMDYTISNVIKSYQDAAVLYWKFVGEANPAWADTISIVVHLPQAASFGEVKAWAHGPLWGDIKFRHGHILMTVKDLPERQFVEARILFPPQWIPQNPPQKDRIQKQILEEEKEYAEQANRRRQQAIIDEEITAEKNTRAYDLAAPIGAGVILLFIFLYWRYGRSIEVNYGQKVDPNIPLEYHPALLNCIYFNNNVTGSTLSTALFGLAQKGILQIEKDTSVTKKWYDSGDPVIIRLDRDQWLSQKENLLDFENELLRFLFESIVQGENRLTSRQLKKASGKMQKWFRNWQKTVKAHLKESPYFERESIKGAIINASVSFVMIVISIFILVTYGINGLYGFLPAVFFCLLSPVILRLTPETKLLKKKLAALRRYLKSFETTSYQPDGNSKISDYFLFAIALAIGKKYTQNILNDISAEEQAVLFPWFLYAGSSGPADFASAINSVVSAASASVSSAAGAGGGGAAGGAG